MRILFVAWKDLAHPKAGGSEVVVDVLARSLMDRGHEVSLLCSAPVEPRPYEVVPNGGMYTQYLRAPFEYARRFRDADLVVDVANGMLFYSPLWRRGPRLCLVHHVHAEQWDRYFPRPVAAAFQVVEARSLPLVYRSTHFIADSDSTVHDLLALGVEPAHVHLMNLGVDVDRPRRAGGALGDPDVPHARPARARTSASTCCSTTGRRSARRPAARSSSRATAPSANTSRPGSRSSPRCRAWCSRAA